VSLGPPCRRRCKKRPTVREGFCRFAIHTQAWSSPREEGLHYKWDEPRDPAASLADPTLGRACHETRCEKRAMTTIVVVTGPFIKNLLHNHSINIK
jgi:hypothetical protein